MMTKAVSKIERGTKRTCQNPECGARFYDLAREQIICPVCNTAYAPPPPITAGPAARTHLRPVKRVVPESRREAEAAPAGDELPVIDGNEEPASENDETLIEEMEEDSPDVSAIIDAPVDPDEKT